MIVNALTIDLEEWFCVSNFAGTIRQEDWPSMESRIERSTNSLLELLGSRGTKATFFVLGWVAERHPEMIRSIAGEGHELASHGYGHQLVYDLTPEAFREDLSKSLAIIEEISGVRCKGYRAPSFSIRQDMDWFWQILAEFGISYDSSIYPVSHDRYGDPYAPRFPFEVDVQGSALLEIPLSTISQFGKNLPVAGGGYLRLYPTWLTTWAIRRIQKEGHPAVVYLHPWEIDPEQPRPQVSKAKLFRHRVGIRSMRSKLDRLLNEFHFGSMEDVFL